jgi:hypothetical protein
MGPLNAGLTPHSSAYHGRPSSFGRQFGAGGHSTEATTWLKEAAQFELLTTGEYASGIRPPQRKVGYD